MGRLPFRIRRTSASRHNQRPQCDFGSTGLVHPADACSRKSFSCTKGHPTGRNDIRSVLARGDQLSNLSQPALAEPLSLNAVSVALEVHRVFPLMTALYPDRPREHRRNLTHCPKFPDHLTIRRSGRRASSPLRNGWLRIGGNASGPFAGRHGHNGTSSTCAIGADLTSQGGRPFHKCPNRVCRLGVNSSDVEWTGRAIRSRWIVPKRASVGSWLRASNVRRVNQVVGHPHAACQVVATVLNAVCAVAGDDRAVAIRQQFIERLTAHPCRGHEMRSATKSRASPCH